MKKKSKADKIGRDKDIESYKLLWQQKRNNENS